MKREPVVIIALIAQVAVQALIWLGVQISPEEQQAALANVEGVAHGIVALIGFAQLVWTRQSVFSPASVDEREEKPRQRIVGGLMVLLTALCVAPMTTGCGFLAKNPDLVRNVITTLLDAEQWLGSVETAAGAYFEQRPNPDAEQRVQAVLQRARGSLRVATRATQGAEKLSQEQIDAAFADFKAAYNELHGLLVSVGILGADGEMRATPGVPPIGPPPLAVSAQ